MKDVIYSINGPVVTVKDTSTFGMAEMVYVGNAGPLIGEVISVSEARTTIQVYENTTGLLVGEPVKGTGAPLSATLGPGIMENIFDGIERPLTDIAQKNGAFIATGVHVDSLDMARRWDVTVTVKPGDSVSGGTVVATCPETSIITHKSMVPPDISGVVTWAAENGQYTVTDPICKITTASGEEKTVCLAQKWPIRTPRPVASAEVRPSAVRSSPGQRVIDTLFPIAKGGTAAIPGGFGTGKTMTQHQLAKWCDADIIVYVGCGERGNEMTQVLEGVPRADRPEIGQAHDRAHRAHRQYLQHAGGRPRGVHLHRHHPGGVLPRHGLPRGHHGRFHLPLGRGAARDLRPSGGDARRRGLPGLPARRLSAFYERAGCVQPFAARPAACPSSAPFRPRAATSPSPSPRTPSGLCAAFWALDKSLAYARHYPAINWTSATANIYDDLDRWYTKNVGEEFLRHARPHRSACSARKTS